MIMTETTAHMMGEMLRRAAGYGAEIDEDPVDETRVNFDGGARSSPPRPVDMNRAPRTAAGL
jgi:hypothetical protein